MVPKKSETQGSPKLSAQQKGSSQPPQGLNPPKPPIVIRGQVEKRSAEPAGGRIETREAKR